jgi:hypothetical protein
MKLSRLIRFGRCAPLAALAAVLLCACSTTHHAHDELSRDYTFAQQCYFRARTNVLVRIDSATSILGKYLIGTGETYVTSWPVLSSDTGLVAACERLFLEAYRSVPDQERADLVPMLATFGTPGTWDYTKTEITSAVYAVRHAVVDELLGELHYGAPPNATIIDSPGLLPLNSILLTLDSGVHLPLNVRRARDELAGLLADRLLNDTEPHRKLVVDRIPFIPFSEKRQTIVTTISEHIASEIVALGIRHPLLDQAIAAIQANTAHPAHQILDSVSTQQQGIQP